jgi:hypothetical protein
MIGIAITVHNRHDVAKKTIEEHQRFLPEGCKFIVVDDCSDTPFPNADFRFEKNAGIAIAKNKCIELLNGCDHFFLFDDDTFPIEEGWHEHYINAGKGHLAYMFATTSTDKYETRAGVRYWNVNRGCMLYFDKETLDRIGGFDNRFIQYNWEHLDISRRATGLEGCMDIDRKVICSLDEDRKVESSVLKGKRMFELYNKLIFFNNRFTDIYRSFEEPVYGPVILTFYSTLHNDPQRNERWDKTVDALLPLINSCRKLNIDLKIFYDSINQPDIDREDFGNVEFIRISPFHAFTPNVYRRIVYHNYLRYRHHSKVFMVDSTDVEVLKNPFEFTEDKLYVGNEEKAAICYSYINKQQKLLNFPDYGKHVLPNIKETLPNAGIIGGFYETVIEFTAKNSDIHREYSIGKKESTDMAAFNYVVWKYFKDKIHMGKDVNTVFRANEYNETSWFKHK